MFIKLTTVLSYLNKHILPPRNIFVMLTMLWVTSISWYEFPLETINHFVRFFLAFVRNKFLPSKNVWLDVCSFSLIRNWLQISTSITTTIWGTSPVGSMIPGVVPWSPRPRMLSTCCSQLTMGMSQQWEGERYTLNNTSNATLLYLIITLPTQHFYIWSYLIS